MIVLDTHALVWAIGNERKLGRRPRALIDRMWTRGAVAVSALTFWEVATLQDKQRLERPLSASEWRAQRLADGPIEIPVDGWIGIRAVDLHGLPDDPADRTIVATALHQRATLVTTDEQLLAWEHTLERHDARL